VAAAGCARRRRARFLCTGTLRNYLVAATQKLEADRAEAYRIAHDQGWI
jgi:hypothetical protein